MDFLTVDRQVSSSSDKKGDESEANEDLEVDNSKSVLLKIATLYAEQLMSDLILEVGGHGYPAHRLILCASSEVFQVMLMNREWSEWRESRIVLQETPTAASVFPHFLKYFYTGQIRISHHTVLPVLSLADKYNVKDLVALCLGYMSQHIAQAAKRAQLISWMQYTMACGHNDVAKECQNFVKWNLEWVWSDSDLSELEGETLVQLLQQSDLVLHNEMSVYRFVVRWLNKQRERLIASDLTEAEFKVHWESLVAAVFSHVRFPMMCPNQLAKLLLCPLTQEHKDFFMERMAIAMSYQSGQYERVSEVQQTEAGRMLFTPRLYTEDTWGSVLAVDNFHSLPCYHTRTFIFSTRPSIADVAPQDKLTEWTVDLYPKGVWFRKSLLIVWAGTYDVPEVVLRTVRISITCQNCPEYTVNQYGETEQLEPDVRVKGTEHRRSPRLRRAEHSAVLARAGQQRLHARGVAAARARQQQVHALRRFYSQQVLFEVLGDLRCSRTEALVRTQQGSIEDTSSDRAPDGLLPRGRGRQRPGMTSNTSASVSLSSQPVREGDALASLFIWCCALEVKVQRVSLVQNAPFCECGLFEIALLVLNVRTVQYGSSGV